MGGVFPAITLFHILLAPLAGFLSDLWDKASVMRRARAGSAAVAALWLAFLWSGWKGLWALYALVGAFATAELLLANTLATALPRLVGPERLSRANGWLELANAVAGILAPALMGLLLPHLGYTGCASLVLVLVGVGLVLIDLRPFAMAPTGRTGGRPSLGGHLLASLASIRSDRRLLLLVLVPFLANLAMAPLGGLVPAMVLLDLGLTSREAGLASAAFAAGVLGATQLFAWVRVAHVGSVGLSVLVLGLGNLGTGLLAYPYFLLGSFLAGGGTIALGLSAKTFLQLLAPPSLLGQVLALQRALRMSSRPLGLFLGGGVAELYGARLSIALLGLFLVLVGLLAHMGLGRARRD